MIQTLSLNLYQILGLEASSSIEYSKITAEQIKQGYHASLLANHPDKLNQSGQSVEVQSNDSNQNASEEITIPAIKTAYSILSNPERRKEYDQQLKLGVASVTGGSNKVIPKSATEQIDLEDMESRVEVAPDGVSEVCIWTKSCRCGEAEGYVLTEQDLIDNGLESTSIIVQCIGCSLWIDVLYAIEE